jgi:Ni/Fe-hydrogenase b-type cytochrome subunit
LGLVQLNVWLDIVFETLYVLVLVGLSAHALGNILTGRAKKKFINWEWPKHEGHVPFLPKFLHFQHVASMILLAISGLYIRFPGFLFPDAWTGLRTPMRYVHYVAMVVVTINLIWRLWYAFASRQRDYREFAITRRDIQTAPQVVMYYLFIKASKPHLDKYNVMQKGTYTLFPILLVFQAFTGFALLAVTLPLINMSPRDILVGWWLGQLVGSTDMAGWWARTVHYIINWLFIIITTIHVYLSLSEDFPAFLNFFGLSALDRKNPNDEGDDHGHGIDNEEEDLPEVAPAFASSDH